MAVPPNAKADVKDRIRKMSFMLISYKNKAIIHMSEKLSSKLSTHLLLYLSALRKYMLSRLAN
ncbi:hypothetical protein GCM10027098_14130 [Bowmanella dokdonensis]